MTEAELDVIHERLRQDINATADRRFLLAEIDRLQAEIVRINQGIADELAESAGSPTITGFCLEQQMGNAKEMQR